MYLRMLQQTHNNVSNPDRPNYVFMHIKWKPKKVIKLYDDYTKAAEKS